MNYIRRDYNMELLKIGQKAKAVASFEHGFESGSIISFVRMAGGYEDEIVYTFKGILDGEVCEQDLIEGEFKLI